MRYSTGLCATLAATAAQAFLIPSMMEDDYVVPNLLDAGPLEHLVPVPCFDCEAPAGTDASQIQAKDIESVLIYNITTSEDRREILLNDFPVYPRVLPEGVVGAVCLPHVPKPHRHLDIAESFIGINDVCIALEDVELEPSTIEILGWNVQRLTIQLKKPFPSVKINVPQFVVNFAEAVNAEGVAVGQKMILDTSYGNYVPSTPVESAPAEEHCGLLCQWKHTASAKLAELKSHMRPHGCAGRRKGHHGVPQGDMPAHEMRPHRQPHGFTAPEFKNRHGPPPPGMRHHGEEHGEHGKHGEHGEHGHHRQHHGHHGHKWRGHHRQHSFLHKARRVAIAIIIPVVAGFAVGLATYMLGYLVGAFVAFVMARFGYERRGYEIIDEEEDVEGDMKVDEEKLPLGYSDEVPVEEEGLPVYVEVESEK